jgi:hypothetical protein
MLSLGFTWRVVQHLISALVRYAHEAEDTALGVALERALNPTSHAAKGDDKVLVVQRLSPKKGSPQ